MDPLTCPDNEVFVGTHHANDLSGAVMASAELANRYFDRRALEREGWVIQRPDALRGAPFVRALHPKVKTLNQPPSVYLTNTKRAGQRTDGPVVQVVYVPVGDEERSWVSSAWQWDLKSWYENDSDMTGRFCCGVLFIKSDF